jgi:SpoVK/Ycf46/Vps4 family AAA+-type ATPase
VDEGTSAQLRSVVDQIQRRGAPAPGSDDGPSTNHGTVVVVHGDDADGRRSTASTLADALHLELHRVDADRIISRWLGETERNLRRVFDESAGSKAVLYFDEADALFDRGGDAPKRGPRDPRRDAVAAWIAHLRAHRGVVVVGMGAAAASVDAVFGRLPAVVRVDLGPSPEPEDD